jgi:hypothetical protein
MAMEDYVNASGDVEFLHRYWDAVKRAYAFTRAHDSDRDGVYENTEGTGWVESWPPGMPHQESYLAALDQQSAESISRLAALLQDAMFASEAKSKADEIRAKLESEYYQSADRFYAFSRNADGTLDRTATINPAVAWGSGRLALAQPGPMLSRWASSEFSTDWGTRDISPVTPFYDPVSYHQGTVWPLFTGWVSLAEYRAGRPLSGYAHLMQNAGLTWSQDLGSVTELLSGEFFQPLGRSSSHQVWSSAMVVTPALRGLFGLDWDALHQTLRVAPHLPGDWDNAHLKNVPLGDGRIDLDFEREGDRLIVKARSASPAPFCVTSQSPPRDSDCKSHELTIPLPAVEVAIPHDMPPPGSQTLQLKAVSENLSSGRYELILEAPGGSEYDLPVRLNRAGVRVSGAELSGSTLRVHFPTGEGYRRAEVVFTW